MAARWLPNMGLVLLVAVLLNGGCRKAALEVSFIGCSDLRSGPVCLFGSETRELRLVVHASPDSKIVLYGGNKTLRLYCNGSETQTTTCTSRGPAAVVRYELPSPQTSFRLRVSQPGSLFPLWYEFSTGPEIRRAAWITQADALRTKFEKLPEAEALIRAQLKRPDLPLFERALGTSELAKVLFEQLRYPEAESAAWDAIKLDEQADLLMQKSSDVFLLADILQDQRRLLKQEEVLESHSSLFTLIGSDRPWLSLYRALAAQTLGNLEKALSFLDDADHWIRLCGDRRSRQTSEMLRASVLSALGQERTDRFIQRAAQQLVDIPCRVGLILRNQAALRIQVLESELGERTQLDAVTRSRLTALWKQWEPGTPGDAVPNALLQAHDQKIQALLKRSFYILSGEGDPAEDAGRKTCRVLRHFTLVLLTQARLALLAGRLQDAHSLLDEVQTRLAAANIDPKGVPTFSIEWNRLEAQLARAEGRYRDAYDYISRLDGYKGDDVQAFEVRWALLMGRAQAYLGQGRYQEALRDLEAADERMEEASRSTPQLFGSGALFGRFEFGTRLLLEQMLRVDETGEVRATQSERARALRYIRHVRVRPLLELARISRLQQLDGNAKRRWDNAVAAYMQARSALDAVQSGIGPQDGQRELKEQVRLRLADALEILGKEEVPRQREPAQGELLFTCHPLRTRWVCLSAQAGHIEAKTVDSDDLVAGSNCVEAQASLEGPPGRDSSCCPPAEGSGDTGGQKSDRTAPLYAGLDAPCALDRIGQRLFGPFREQFARAQPNLLTVLGYGLLRDIPVHLLQWEGWPQSQPLQVRYELDVGSASSPPENRHALIAVDSIMERIPTRENAPAVGELVRSLLARGNYWNPKVLRLGSHGNPQGKQRGNNAEQFREELAGAGLLILFGHADYAPAAGWVSGLIWSQWHRLTGGDVLTLGAPVPRVIIIACNSGNGEDPIGGQESLGLAQAFLLAGSQEVLATTRAVSAESGAYVAHGVADYLGKNPAASLDDALESVLALQRAKANKQEAGGMPEEDPQTLLIRSEIDAFRVIHR